MTVLYQIDQLGTKCSLVDFEAENSWINIIIINILLFYFNYKQISVCEINYYKMKNYDIIRSVFKLRYERLDVIF